MVRRATKKKKNESESIGVKESEEFTQSFEHNSQEEAGEELIFDSESDQHEEQPKKVKKSKIKDKEKKPKKTKSIE